MAAGLLAMVTGLLAMAAGLLAMVTGLLAMAAGLLAMVAGLLAMVAGLLNMTVINPPTQEQIQIMADSNFSSKLSVPGTGNCGLMEA